MKPAHVIDRTGAQALGDLTGAGRMRQSVKGGGAPVFDPIGAVAPVEGPGESLWRGARGKKRPAAALYRHWSAPAHLGQGGAAAGGRSGTGRRPPRPRPCRTAACGGAMPQLL